MSRYTGPVVRQMRRAGVDLFLKSSRSKSAKRFTERLYPPGQHGKMQKKLSTYGTQLLEKQKLKWMFGVHERALRNYMAKAVRYRGVTGTVLLQLLERRLDNVVCRAGYAVTRRQGRQLVRHNHILVNGQRVNIPSYSVRPGDVISLSEAAKKNPHVAQALEYTRMDGRKPWIDFNEDDMSAKFTQVPSREDLDDLPIKEQLIVELYSK